MNYLELHNAVLDRLRENRIVSSDVGTNPYVRVIGTFINDAKDAVEAAWNWGCLRGEDTFSTAASNELVTLTGSADNHYLLGRIRVVEEGMFLRWKTVAWMDQAYVNDTNQPVMEGRPYNWAHYYDATDGNLRIRLYPRPDAIYTLKVERLKHQDPLVAYDDELLVPSLPVYSLATALASRERGEIGGTPTSELFAIADSHLSDAIALDTAKYPEEQIWYNSGDMSGTNVSK